MNRPGSENRDLFAIADLAAEGVLAPAPYTAGRYELTKWLNFISTELHKGVFAPLMTTAAPEGARAWARHLAHERFALLSAHLAARPFLLDSFSVADAYLFTCTRWAPFCKVDLAGLDRVAAFMARVAARPAVQDALRAEGLLKAA